VEISAEDGFNRARGDVGRRSGDVSLGGEIMTDLSIVAIIPLYNGAPWIENAIRSVFAQTLQPDEFIVVDDGSTDGGAGAAIVERLAKERPITLAGKANGGQSSARNFGVRHSFGALIALLDQDDWWHPEHLEELLKPFEQDRHCRIGWVYSDLDRLDGDGSLHCERFLATLRNKHPKRHIKDCLSQDMFVLPSASLIRRKAFDEIGGFDERLCGYEDDDLFLRLFRAGWRNEFLPQSLSRWRIFSASTSYTERMSKSRMIYLDKLLRAFPDQARTGFFPARQFIAPRFTRILVADILIAAREPDWPRVVRNASDLDIAAATLPWLHRLVVRAFAFVLRVPLMAKPAVWSAVVVCSVRFLLARRVEGKT
jgi:GT2 family glycosyltransferase